MFSNLEVLPEPSSRSTSFALLRQAKISYAKKQELQGTKPK